MASVTASVFQSARTIRTRFKAIHLAIVAQVLFISILAYFAELLIYDEMHWYRIDKYDAIVWGILTTQLFASALFVSRARIRTIAESVRVFGGLAFLAVGLTIAGMAFLVRESWNDREPFPALSIGGGYWLAAFVFLITMFLQLRLALWCLHAIASLFWPHRTDASEETVPWDAPTEGRQEGTVVRHFAIVDALAFTGLAAVSVAGFRMTLRLMQENDTIRLMALFYAGALLSLLCYVLMHVPLRASFKVLACLAFLFVLAFFESRLGVAYSSRRMPIPIDFFDSLMWNCIVFFSALVQMILLRKGLPTTGLSRSVANG